MKNIIVKVIIGILALLGMSVGGYQVLGGREYQVPHYVLNGVVTTTWGTEYGISDYRHITFLTTCENATTTIKFACSDLAPESVAFTSAASASNHWDYCQVIDLQNGTSIDGDTGFSCAGVSDIRRFALNEDLAATINVYNDWTSGTTTVQIIYNNNQ